MGSRAELEEEIKLAFNDEKYESAIAEGLARAIEEVRPQIAGMIEEAMRKHQPQ